jgi:hypothetical protein
MFKELMQREPMSKKMSREEKLREPISESLVWNGLSPRRIISSGLWWCW